MQIQRGQKNSILNLRLYQLGFFIVQCLYIPRLRYYLNNHKVWLVTQKMFIICCSSHSSLIIRCSEGTVQLENISKPHSIQGICCPCITDKQVKALISEGASPCHQELEYGMCQKLKFFDFKFKSLYFTTKFSYC